MNNQPSILLLLFLMFSTVLVHQGYLIVVKKYTELAGLKNSDGYTDFEKVVFLIGLARMVTGVFLVAVCVFSLFDMYPPTKIAFFLIPAVALPAIVAVTIINRCYVRLD